MYDCIVATDLKFRELGPSCFIWLPIKNVPICDFIRVNSLRQPALSVFKLVQNSSLQKFLSDDQEFLGELAQQYDEAGYFLLHHDDLFGIIGILEEYKPFHYFGRATIFNACKIKYREEIPPIEVPIVNCSVKFPWKGVGYKKGDIVDYDNTRTCNHPPIWCDDD